VPKVAIWNAYWSSLGGGERMTLDVANAMVERGCEVDILTSSWPGDSVLKARLGMDVLPTVRGMPSPGESEVMGVARSYDVVLNATYLSFCPAPIGVESWRLVFFPEPGIPSLTLLGRTCGPDWDVPGLRGSGLNVETWRPRELRAIVGMRREADATLPALAPAHVSGDLDVDSERVGGLVIHLPRRSPLAVASFRLVSGDRAEVAHATVRAGEYAPIRFPQCNGVGKSVQWEATGFPAATDGGTAADNFRGPVITGVLPPGALTRRNLSRRRVLRAGLDLKRSLMAGYDRVLTISDFTADWSERIWQVKTDRLFPAVPAPTFVPEPEEKSKLILTVGRFFPPGSASHYKGQREMIDAYARLPTAVRDDWRFVLVGGVSKEHSVWLSELERLAAAAGAELLTNLDQGELDRLRADASIYWHATGIGSNPNRRPEVQEHFGIAPLEAMASGAVPVVIDCGGMRETIRHGVDGFRWSSREQLSTLTLALIHDSAARERMSKQAMDRFRSYSYEVLFERVRELLDGVTPENRQRDGSSY
jgi:glycosyltransferase involved in cell wall biosynthesis